MESWHLSIGRFPTRMVQVKLPPVGCANDIVGEGVDPTRIGERVWIYEGQFEQPFGTAAEYIVVPERKAVHLPDRISYAEGAGMRGELVMMVAKGEQLLEINKLLESGQLKTIFERVFPLRETAQALELNKTGHPELKVRSVPRQIPPYRPLSDVVKQQQRIFELRIKPSLGSQSFIFSDRQLRSIASL